MEKEQKIIATALMNYINDSAGEGSKEAKEIQEAWTKLVSLPIDSVEKVTQYLKDNGEDEEKYETYAFEQGIDDQVADPSRMDEDHIYTHIRRIDEAL